MHGPDAGRLLSSHEGVPSRPAASAPTSGKRSVLLVDLNNFGRYPSLSIGYLTAVLRQHAYAEVSVFSPLMMGVQGVTREAEPRLLGLLAAQLNHCAATSPSAFVRRCRAQLAARQLSGVTAQRHAVVAAVKAEIARVKPDAVLISTYLMYRDVCEHLCAAGQAHGARVVIGGPYFAQPEIVADWVRIKGLAALVAGEVELMLPAIVETLLGDGDLSRHAGIIVADAAGRPKGRIAEPLQALDDVPFPDFADFPWAAYPHRLVPVITGRGCGWGACTFCSDITSTAGRTYRSRSPAEVLREVAQQRERYGAAGFVFTDLKLNSNIPMWRALAEGMQDAAPGSHWVGAVHAGMEDDNGLSQAQLHAAARSGCVRLSTGLESGSQRVIDAMKKGTRIEAVSAFLHAAAAAAISCRCTMMVGYPGETAEDVHASARFLASHGKVIERVSLNRLSVNTGTTLHRWLQGKPDKFRGFHIVSHDAGSAQVEHHNSIAGSRAHRKAVMQLLTEVHRINARKLSSRARQFDGVM